MNSYIRRNLRRLRRGKKTENLGKLSIFELHIFRQEFGRRLIKAEPDYKVVDNLLGGMKFFKSFGEDFRLRLYSLMKYKLVAKGTVLSPDLKYVVINGSVQIKMQLDSDIFRTVTLYEGDSVGELDVIRDKESADGHGNSVATTLGETDLLFMD